MRADSIRSAGGLRRPAGRRAGAICIITAALALSMGCFDDPGFEEHVLNRLGYGANEWSQNRLREIGLNAYIEEQLEPHTIDDSEFEAMLSDYPSHFLLINALYAWYGSGLLELGDSTQPLRELKVAKLLRAVHSRRQLQAVLTDFWFNHLNVDASDGVSKRGVVPYERKIIRDNVFGYYDQMLIQSARSPAMLDYLDNNLSFKEGAIVGGEERGINENYARELMELHTLGVDAPYSQDDVINVARAFTGWRIDWSWANSGFQFQSQHHDEGEKQLFSGLFLGLNIAPGGGVEEGERIIRHLVRHPATAERLSRKLCQRFYGDNPPEQIVQNAKAEWLESGGNLRRVTRVILNNTIFPTEPRHTKVKRPFVLVASALRALGADLSERSFDELYGIVRDIEAMGEPLYQFEDPTGMPETSEFFAGSSAMLDRFNFLRSLAYDASEMGVHFDELDELPPQLWPDQLVTALGERFVPAGLSENTQAWLTQFSNELYFDNLSNEDRIAEVAGAMMASREFLYH